MRAGGCQCKGTSRHTLEFSREFDRQEPVDKCEVAFFLGITACHPPVTPATLRKGCKRPVHRRSVTLSPFKYFFPVCACAQHMTGCLFVMICCRKSWQQRATEKSGCAEKSGYLYFFFYIIFFFDYFFVILSRICNQSWT